MQTNFLLICTPHRCALSNPISWIDVSWGPIFGDFISVEYAVLRRTKLFFCFVQECFKNRSWDWCCVSYITKVLPQASHECIGDFTHKLTTCVTLRWLRISKKHHQLCLAKLKGSICLCITVKHAVQCVESIALNTWIRSKTCGVATPKYAKRNDIRMTWPIFPNLGIKTINTHGETNTWGVAQVTAVCSVISISFTEKYPIFYFSNSPQSETLGHPAL